MGAEIVLLVCMFIMFLAGVAMGYFMVTKTVIKEIRCVNDAVKYAHESICTKLHLSVKDVCDASVADAIERISSEMNESK